MKSPTMEEQFQSSLEKLRAIVLSNQHQLSGQLSRRLTNLIESSSSIDLGRHEARLLIARRISAVFHRLILELIQAHYNTEQREKDFRRLMKSKGCAIDLMDEVIDIIVRLYKAGQDHQDGISFERGVLIRFIMKELKSIHNLDARHVEKTIQTLYRCSCFDVIKRNDKEINELKLKSHLCDATNLSIHCDAELIAIAQEHQIRLNPESWAYLLHKNHPDVSRMQSLMDRCQTVATFSELEQTLNRVGDKYNISSYLIELGETQELLKCFVDPDRVDMEFICNLMEKLTHFEQLFILRQRRNACSTKV